MLVLWVLIIELSNLIIEVLIIELSNAILEVLIIKTIEHDYRIID